MFSKILVKLIDQAIVPAVLVFASRIISLLLISNYLGIELIINTQGIVFDNPNDYLVVNSYSLSAMVILMALGMLFVLLKSTLFHHEHITPSTTAKLFSLKMPSLIKNSFEIYSQSTIWISYLWLLTLTTGLMYYYEMVYSWVFYLSAVFSISLTVLLIIDVEKKVKVSNKNDFTFDEDTDNLETEEEK